MPLLSRRDLLASAMLLPVLEAGGAEAPPTAVAAAPPELPDRVGPFLTRHRGTFGSRTLDYVATVGETVIADGDGHPRARFVTTAYVEPGVDPAARPVLFAFNGGPSTASALLHFVALGPRRLVIGQDPAVPETPTRAVDNPLCVLDVADLVFVDPVETGYSRVLPGARREEFYSVNGDAQSVSDFVGAWVRANGRERSPKYVLGESYGTLRAAVMAGQLAAAMPLEGVFLLGQAVNMIETSQRAKNALAYATNLPALAAVAAYHGRARPSTGTPAEIVDAAYRYGMGEYLQALVRGQDLPGPERRRVAARLEALTGIGQAYYLEHDLAITKIAFATELLKDRGQTLAIYDGRYATGVHAPGETATDPIMAIFGAASTLFRRYLAEDLAVALPPAEYRDMAPGAEHWEWNGTLGPGGPFLDYDYQARLSEAFRANPRFRLVIGTGYHDLTTTIGPARYLVTRSDYPRDRVVQRQYFGGHMAYIHEPSLAALAADLRAWLQGGRPA